MADFDINTFTKRIRELMYPYFPYESDDMAKIKHKNRPLHIRDVAFMNNPIIYGMDQNTFDIGGESAEKKYPYYHILEDSPVIRKRGKGTEKTKGSQAKIEDLGKRDYGIVSQKRSKKGDKYTYTKEYARNVRGSRKRLGSVSHWASDYNGDKFFINREANAYLNVHYHYIENILNNGMLDTLASEFGLKRKRTVDTGLEEEYLMQESDIDNTIKDMLNSF